MHQASAEAVYTRRDVWRRPANGQFDRPLSHLNDIELSMFVVVLETTATGIEAAPLLLVHVQTAPEGAFSMAFTKISD